MRYLSTKKPIKTVRSFKVKNEDGKEVETTRDVEATLEIGQFDNLDEAIQEAGSPEKFLDWVNSKKEADAKVAPRNYGKSASESMSDDEVIAKMQELAKNHSIGAARTGVGVKAKAEAFDELANLVKSNENVTRDDLLKLLATIR